MSTEKRTPMYLSIWGDTVDFREFLIGLAIGVVLGAISADGALRFLKAYFSHLSTGALMGAALMIGASGSILAGVITAILFKPKRIVSEKAQSIATANLEEEFGINMEEEAEYLRNAPPEIIDEMKKLNLYHLFIPTNAVGEKTDG